MALRSHDVIFPAREAVAPQDEVNSTANTPSTPTTTESSSNLATHLVDDVRAPEITDPDAAWIRPAKAFATYIPTPITGLLPKSYKDAVARPGGVGEYWKKSSRTRLILLLILL
ncbi:hypothetical protein EMCG_06514 [[Emmonsia] crescens]|uniref:Uncharacterized protein n=1 Tax=[Emmonsia] crescens TaxID=73230 RepID=A0A0G2J6P9_9EURO|nr:hypothetical protein EMCG_06514 [Emmonsia crescens UAMH 3008]